MKKVAVIQKFLAVKFMKILEKKLKMIQKLMNYYVQKIKIIMTMTHLLLFLNLPKKLKKKKKKQKSKKIII